MPTGARADTIPATVCTNFFGVVIHPAFLLGGTSPSDHAIFGSVAGLPSNITCAGGLVGTATITGISDTCRPEGTNEGSCPSTSGDAAFLGPVIVTANSSPPVPALFARSESTATVSGLAPAGLHFADNALGGDVTCTIHSVGSAGTPGGALMLHNDWDCTSSDNPGVHHIYAGDTNLILQVVVGPAGNLLQTGDPAYDQDLCPTVPADQVEASCYRAVLLEGVTHLLAS